uniref:EF-hand domain-containing protein n=1 Tax=Acrobeloides nanus TaxID=290746 RepID=A0A914C3J6_9BILA
MITSTREGVHDKYWHEGFGYTFRRTCKNWDTYYCQYRDKKKCMVSARYHRELGTFEVSGTHQDDPEPAAMEACLLMRRIYEMAAELRTVDPRKIVEMCFGDASPEALRLTPDKEHIYRAIRKIKHEKGFDVEEPKSLANINIGKLELLETIDGEKMFFADTGVIEGTRSLIFTTPSLLEVLAQAKGIACDATCDVIRNAFMCFDEDNNGKISEDRLRELLTTMGDRYTDEQVDELFRDAPIKNGQFDYMEFTRMLKHGTKDKDDQS